MFGFGLAKLLFTVAAVAAVWYGFKMIAGRSAKGSSELDRRAAAKPAARPIEAEEMTACPACGTYVPRHGARACDRGDCPYPA